MKNKQSENIFFSLRSIPDKTSMDLRGFWSYPAFLCHKKNTDREIYWLYLILPTVLMHEEKRTALFRPKAMLLTKPNSKTAMRYENYRIGHDPFPKEKWDSPVAMYPYKSIEGMSRRHLHKAELQLLESCINETSQFKETGRLSKEFIEAWTSLIHPVFLPFLEHLTPGFVQALDIKQSSSV